VIESEKALPEMAERLAEYAARLRVPVIFKASYDKANRTLSIPSVARDSGRIAHPRKVREVSGLPVLSDVHEHCSGRCCRRSARCDPDPRVSPAVRPTWFRLPLPQALRQPEKGQFLSPQEMGKVLEKARANR